MGCSIVNHPSGGTPIYSIYGTPKSNQLVSGSSCQEDLEEKVVQILTVASATQMQGPSRVQQGHFVKKNIGNMVYNMSPTASYDESYVICNDSINVMQLLLTGRI